MNINKKVFRDIFISSICFLCIMWIAFQWMTSYFPISSNSITVSKEEKHKVMYLTFDDGPSKHTQAILDILDTYKVKATFFVTGSNTEYYDKIKLAHDRGHEIAIHTFSHDYKKIYSSEDAYFKDLNEMNHVIEKQIGHKANIVRFPGGSSNTVSRKYQKNIMSHLTTSVINKGYQYYDWNASNGDGNSHLHSNKLVSIALKETKGKDDVMMLMHDGTGNQATVEALPTLLKKFINQGYTFEVINAATSDVFHHHISN